MKDRVGVVQKERERGNERERERERENYRYDSLKDKERQTIGKQISKRSSKQTNK